MKLYLVRHGQTEYNVALKHHHDHIGLSEVGIQQAEKLSGRFLTIPIDIIYSSILERAKHTAIIINKTLKKDIIYSDFLNEIKNPSEIIGKKRDNDEVKKVHRTIADNQHNPTWHYSDEENFNEFKNRVGKFLGILEKTPSASNVLAVTHGGPIRMLALFILLGENFIPENFYKFKTSLKINNASITICEKEPGKGWTIKIFNDCAHLNEKS